MQENNNNNNNNNNSSAWCSEWHGLTRLEEGSWGPPDRKISEQLCECSSSEFNFGDDDPSSEGGNFCVVRVFGTVGCTYSPV